MFTKTMALRPSRRQFLTSNGALLGAAHIAGPAFGQNRDLLRVGLVGCGGRGRGAAQQILMGSPNVELVAIADVFQESIDIGLEALKKPVPKIGPLQGFKVTPDRCFLGLDAYKQVMDLDIDAVLLASPPGYRPDHLEYAVERGLHIFTEKPGATDPVGIRRILALENKAKSKGLVVVSGFNTHHEVYANELVDRVHNGAVGNVISLHAYYNTNNIWFRDRKPGMSDRDWWMHNWYHVDWMCGDHIVEQHVHNIDQSNWIMQAHPVRAYGMGGRQYNTDRPGNIYDHFAVEFEYPNGVRLTSLCRQINGTDGKIGCDIIGDKGAAYFFENGYAEIYRPTPWKHERRPNENEGHYQEQIDFVRYIREGRKVNELRQLAESTMSAMMGRESAYTGKNVTWDEMLHSTLKLVPENFAAWDGTIRPVPKPGMKRA